MCDKKNVGSEYNGEWYCRDCGFQWEWTPMEWKEITGEHRY